MTTHSITITGLAPSKTYNWRVRSMDAAGNESVSANSTFATAAVSDTTAPTVTWSGPTANSILLGTVTLTATASDNVAVGGVQFLLDGNALLGTEDTTSPYSFSWNTTTASDDTYSEARARDRGNTATTAAISVTVDNLAPTGSVAKRQRRGDEKHDSNFDAVCFRHAGSRDADAFLQRRHHVFCGRSLCDVEELGGFHQRRQNQDGLRAISRCRGNWSTAATDTIVLDTTAPSTSAITATVSTRQFVGHDHLDDQRTLDLADRLRPHDKLRLDHAARIDAGDSAQRHADRSDLQRHLQFPRPL